MSLIAFNEPLSLVLEYLGDPEYAQLPGWDGAGELLAGRIWRQIRERPPSPVGAIANTLDTLPITTSEKLHRLVEQVYNEFAYRSQLGWATWAQDKIYDPKWADQVDTRLSRLDLDEAEQVLTAMARSFWDAAFVNGPFTPLEEAFPPHVVQDHLEYQRISDRVSVKDVNQFMEFIRQRHPEIQPHNPLTSADIAYFNTPRTKLLVSSFFRLYMRGMIGLNRFPSIFIRDFKPEKLLVEGKYCRFPRRFPPNCLRVLHLCDFNHLQLPEGVFDGMDTLEELYLDRSFMPSLPRLGRLPRLIRLFSGWGTKRLPESLGDLPNLKELYLDGNELQVVPSSIFDSLPSLKLIDLSNNPLNPKRIDAPDRVKVIRDGLSNNWRGRGTIVQAALSFERTGEWLIEYRYWTLLGLLLLAAVHLYCELASFPNT